MIAGPVEKPLRSRSVTLDNRRPITPVRAKEPALAGAMPVRATVACARVSFFSLCVDVRGLGKS